MHSVARRAGTAKIKRPNNRPKAGQPNPPGGFLVSGKWKMPHAFIRYRLPEEQTEFSAAMQGGDAKATLWAVDQHCRSILKHGEPSEETRRHLEEIREMLRERPGLLDD